VVRWLLKAGRTFLAGDVGMNWGVGPKSGAGKNARDVG
jgi:hypothetical protein